MSLDLIVFDPNGLDNFPSEEATLVDAVNAYVANAEHHASTPKAKPTAKLQELITLMEQKFGTLKSEHSPWTTWPPAVIAQGRYCVFNLGRGSDFTNMTIHFLEAVRPKGLILIDPQGKEGLLSAPDGSGLLDF